ncbi:MAG: trypsin-like peptidase domain-containing protein [Eubacteriales bacterium]|nr:trypsin-like peptidase domain-containing protein [Eubacteriales bacterium]
MFDPNENITKKDAAAAGENAAGEEPVENTETKETNRAADGSASDAEQEEPKPSVTYSWVNPRLQNSDEVQRERPWGSSTDRTDRNVYSGQNAVPQSRPDGYGIGEQNADLRNRAAGAVYGGQGAGTQNRSGGNVYDGPNAGAQNGFGGNSYGEPNAGAQNRTTGNGFDGQHAGFQNRSFGNAYGEQAGGAAGNTAGNTYRNGNGFRRTATGTTAQGNYPPPGGFDDKGKERKSRQAMSQTPVKKSEGRRWANLVAMAVVFGLVAGLVMTGVNAVGNRLQKPANTNASEAVTAESSASKPAANNNNTESTIPKTETPASNAAAETTGGGTVADVAREVMPSLVTISTMSVQEMQSFFGGTQEYTVEGAGSGVIIDENDTELLIATNNHVIQGATELSVGFVDESAIKGAVKGADEETDLAIVAVKLEDIPEETKAQIKMAVIGDSESLVLGEQVVAIGNALGYGQSVTSGYVSGLNRELQLSDGSTTITSDDLIQTDAAINSGNSGGALLNMKGELIGINEAKSSGSTSGASVDNVGYAIPMAKAEPILRELMNEETREIISEEEQGYLGVSCADVTSDYSELYNVPEGVCFTRVVEGGPADAAGVINGDIMTKFNGKSIKSFSSLKKKLQYYRAGETVEITIMRANNGEYEEQTMQITLGEKSVLDKLQTEQQEP